MKTAEEAAREFSESVWDDVPADMTFSDYAFIKGAKWRQEQNIIDPMTKHANENALIIPLNKAMQEIDSLKSQLQQSQAEVATWKEVARGQNIANELMHDKIKRLETVAHELHERLKAQAIAERVK